MNCKVLRTSIYLSWILLIACFIIKALGGNWFEIAYQSTWLEEHKYCSVLVFSITSYILFNLYYMAIVEVKHFKFFVHILLVPYFIGISFVKVFILDSNIHLILDIVSGILIPMLILWAYLPKPKKQNSGRMIRVILAFVLNCGFQAISVMVRGFPTGVVVSNMLTQVIMSLDILIMMALYWFYSLYYKKEEKK